jgi:hypothetical protein
MTFKSVLDPEFQYRSADCTDVRLTFERIRREQRKAQRLAAPVPQRAGGGSFAPGMSRMEDPKIAHAGISVADSWGDE